MRRTIALGQTLMVAVREGTGGIETIHHRIIELPKCYNLNTDSLEYFPHGRDYLG
jgi:hypothetical protein